MRGFDYASEDDMDDKAASARIPASANCLTNLINNKCNMKKKIYSN
jgi:hypothetical protein